MFESGRPIRMRSSPCIPKRAGICDTERVGIRIVGIYQVSPRPWQVCLIARPRCNAKVPQRQDCSTIFAARLQARFRHLICRYAARTASPWVRQSLEPVAGWSDVTDHLPIAMGYPARDQTPSAQRDHGLSAQIWTSSGAYRLYRLWS